MGTSNQAGARIGVSRRVARTSRLLRAASILFVLVGGVYLAAQLFTGRAARTSAPHFADSPPTRATVPGRRVNVVKTESNSLGRFGVQAAWVTRENAKRGTTAWQITSPSRGFIDGFADHVDAHLGDRIGMYVTTNADSFHVAAYRMGDYGGAGARLVWSSPSIRGSVQPQCPVTPGTNMVACDNWSRSTTFVVTSAFVPGDYLLKLVGNAAQQSWVLLTVSDPASHAAYLLVGRSLTEQGWNSYGGFDFYQGHGRCPPGSSTYPVCNRARVVSFDRPYADGTGPSDFLANEYPLVRFCEQHGLDVTYLSDITIDEHPELLIAHRAILSLGHDETWTYAERKGAQLALAHGVNIAFFGAAAVLRHSRLQASPLGPDREQVDYRNANEDPLARNGDPMQVTANTWGSPPTNLSEVGFVGQEYGGYMKPGTGTVPLVVLDASAWIFNGTGLRAGSGVPGVIDSDFDHINSGAIPPGLQVLAHSPIATKDAVTNQHTSGAVTYSDMTYYTHASSQGGVFDSGTVNWINALTPCPPGPSCPAQTVGDMTANLLWLFGQGPAGTFTPSKANVHTLTPHG